MSKNDYLLSYIDEIENIIGKSWTFKVILELRRHQQIRFNELQNLLEGISTSTLTISLKKLENKELVLRYSHGIISPLKAGYSLTDKGYDLLIALFPLLRWGITNHVSNERIKNK